MTKITKVDDSNLDEVLDIGEKTLNELYDLAMASQDQEAYKNLIQLIKVMGDIKLKLASTTTPKEAKPNVVNNSMFIGSTNELLKLIEQKLEADV